MKQCPCCGSGNVREGKINGVWYLVCHTCGYDSSERDKSRHEQHKRKERERERQR